jgi:hypothetical protein
MKGQKRRAVLISTEDRRIPSAEGGAVGNTTHHALPNDAVMKEGCVVCKLRNDKRSMLLCNICDDGYHTYCLEPPLPEVPEDFQCPLCLSAKKPKSSSVYQVTLKSHLIRTEPPRMDTKTKDEACKNILAFGRGAVIAQDRLLDQDLQKNLLRQGDNLLRQGDSLVHQSSS